MPFRARYIVSYRIAVEYIVGLLLDSRALFAVGVAGVRPRLENISKNVAGVAFWPPQLFTAIREVRPDDRYCRYCDQSVDYSVHPHNHSSGLISTFFQCIPTQLLQHKSWTSFAARRTSRLTVWPPPVIHQRSCCTSQWTALIWLMLLAVCINFVTWSLFAVHRNPNTKLAVLKRSNAPPPLGLIGLSYHGCSLKHWPKMYIILGPYLVYRLSAFMTNRALRRWQDEGRKTKEDMARHTEGRSGHTGCWREWRERYCQRPCQMETTRRRMFWSEREELSL